MKSDGRDSAVFFGFAEASAIWLRQRPETEISQDREEDFYIDKYTPWGYICNRQDEIQTMYQNVRYRCLERDKKINDGKYRINGYSKDEGSCGCDR